MKKKGIILFVGLLLPVLVFMFLRYFGKNRFDVPLPYANGVEAPENCDWNYGKPYLIPDTLWNHLKAPSGTKLIGVSYEDTPAIREIFKSHPDDLHLIDGDALELNDPVAAFYRDCLLLVKGRGTLVLIDDKRNIRGHYNVYDQDEIDRLKTEVDILLEKY